MNVFSCEVVKLSSCCQPITLLPGFSRFWWRPLNTKKHNNTTLNNTISHCFYQVLTECFLFPPSLILQQQQQLHQSRDPLVTGIVPLLFSLVVIKSTTDSTSIISYLYSSRPPMNGRGRKQSRTSNTNAVHKMPLLWIATTNGSEKANSTSLLLVRPRVNSPVLTKSCPTF